MKNNNLVLLLGWYFFFYVTKKTKPQEELGIFCAVLWSVKPFHCLQPALGGSWQKALQRDHQMVLLPHNVALGGYWVKTREYVEISDCLEGRHCLLGSTAGYWQPLHALPLSGPEWEFSGMSWLFLQAAVAPGDHLHTSTFRLFVCTHWAIFSTIITSEKKKKEIIITTEWSSWTLSCSLLLNWEHWGNLGTWILKVMPKHVNICLHEIKYWLMLLMNITAVGRNWAIAFYPLSPPESWYSALHLVRPLK